MRDGYRAGVPSLRDQLAEARRLGFEVAPIRRTGECRVICTGGSPCHLPARVNQHSRKDGTSEIERMLRDHRSRKEPIA